MVCDACREEIYRWQDTKPSQFGGIRISNNAMFDMSERGSTENVRSRYNDWVQLVQRQTRMIREACARDHLESAA